MLTEKEMRFRDKLWLFIGEDTLNIELSCLTVWSRCVDPAG